MSILISQFAPFPTSTLGNHKFALHFGIICKNSVNYLHIYFIKYINYSYFPLLYLFFIR